ncbi:MAG TPA: hypothetical protein VIL35_14370 [Vicinamibacterales bacterium]
MFVLEFVTPAPLGLGIYRIPIDSPHLEFVATLADQRPVCGLLSYWFGLTPDDGIMFLQDLSIHELYALELDR